MSGLERVIFYNLTWMMLDFKRDFRVEIDRLSGGPALCDQMVLHIDYACVSERRNDDQQASKELDRAMRFYARMYYQILGMTP